NAHFELLPNLSGLEFISWSNIKNDSRNNNIDRIKVGIIEGVIRTEKDTTKVKLFRKMCDIIVSLGACACYGSIPGLANLYDEDELIKSEFIKTEIPVEKTPEEPNFPNFENYIYNVKDIIHVDIFIPGCPPKTENIIATISYLKTFNKDIYSSQDQNECVCDNCDLFNKGCFLEDGKLCYGAITAAGCKLMCPNNGDICFGCFKHTYNPGEKAEKLEELLINLNQLNEETRANLQHFLMLYLGATNITSFYFYDDLMQRLAYEPESFNKKEKNINNNLNLILDINPTGIEINDDIIGSILFLLKNDPNFKFSSKTVCSHCDRTIVDKVPIKLKRDYEGLPTTDKCFLEQGYICLGLVTHAGCGTICPNKANAPCLGCYGPPLGVKDQGVKFMSTLGSLCTDLEPTEIIQKIKDPAGLFNRFTVADSVLGQKFHDNMDDT
ncbi:MAG: hypothetical protein ACFFBZ_13425, partial [Promethearchaeota archaeon]